MENEHGDAVGRRGINAMDPRETGKAITYLRKAKNLTQKDVAGKLNISDKAVSKWERGLAIPDVSLLAKLSIMLDTDIESLLEGNIAHYNQRWNGLMVLDSNADDDIISRMMLFDKPMVYFQLSYFMLVGIRRICIVCSEKTEIYIKGAADWTQFGMELTFARNKNADGVRLENIENPEDENLESFLSNETNSNTMVLYGNAFMYGADLTKHFQRAMAKVSKQNAEVALLLIQSAKGQYGIEDYRIKQISESASDLRYFVGPFLFLSPKLIRENVNIVLDGSQVLANLLKRDVAYATIGRGVLFKRICSFEDVNDASNLVKIIQSFSDENIADIGEIAKRRDLA